MDIVVYLRELWRRRVLVACIALLAILAGVLTAYRPGVPPSARQYEVGIASARALVDTPRSRVVDLGVQEGSDTTSLSTRAALLANLLTTSPLREQIATRAGLDPRKLVTLADTPGGPAPDGEPLTDGDVDADDPDANVVTFQTNETLPMINAEARAPDREAAARLSDASIAVLEDHLEELVRETAVPASQRVVLKPLGAARSATEQRGPSRIMALLTALAVFAAGCGALLLAGALMRDWRNSATAEQWGDETLVLLDVMEEDARDSGEAPLERSSHVDAELRAAEHASVDPDVVDPPPERPAFARRAANLKRS